MQWELELSGDVWHNYCLVVILSVFNLRGRSVYELHGAAEAIRFVRSGF